jgi:hypothetical protein
VEIQSPLNVIKRGAEFCDQDHILEPTSLVQNHFMQHRGVRYAIRIGIEREQWRVAIHFPGKGSPEERTVFGTRQDAEIAARSMINARQRKRPELKKN